MSDADAIVGSDKSTLGKVEKEAGKAAGDAEGVVEGAADQMKATAEDLVENMSNAGAAAYDRASELVAKGPGNALLMAGAIGFALGVLLTKGSQPRRNALQRYYDRYGG